ncbi:nicotinate-nucleotide adenylyltransferase [invertebrate metagenome]|uniref:Nicotinate-nucleotide adenylyltransferase n=1 Tax=invertebrate metagenome TaxID=1711999 RepID=A0A2H9T521_9ZZZZ
MNKSRIGVLGSAFDPPTMGHLDVILQAAPYMERILLVPSAAHPFGKQLVNFSHRLKMLELFISDISVNHCQVESCDLEYSLLADNPDHPVYTYDLLKRLEAIHQDKAELCFIRGPDNAKPAIWKRFYNADKIEQHWPIFTAQSRVRIRSSMVRRVLREFTNSQGKELLRKEFLKKMLSPSVYRYILNQNLYLNTGEPQ